MLFNTLEFWLFFIPVFIINHLLSHKYQNRFLLFASYVFYASWDWRLLSLILFSTLVAHASGLIVSGSKDEKTRKLVLTLSIIANLSILFFFKYADFFIESFIDLFNLPDSSRDDLLLNIVLPVGISFYTFQSISYTVDAFRHQVKPVRQFIDTALYVSFFPQLIAGPIERGAHLIPQITMTRIIDKKAMESGIYLIAWGLFKKVVIADSLAHPVNAIFDAESSTAFEVYIAVCMFAVQIYCDFSGYTDIARGLGRLLGFDLMLNFNLPYIAKNPSDFWRRWHISLSTWLRDYLYIPLGGNRQSELFTYRNLIITMVLGGLWHGAQYNFLLWGIFHGVILAIHRFYSHGKEPRSGKIGDLLKIIGMFQLTLIGWLIFRVENMDQLARMTTDFVFNWHSVGISASLLYYAVPLVLPLIAMQVWQYRSNNLEVINTVSWPLKATFVAFCLASVLFLNRADGAPFIYFQF